MKFITFIFAVLVLVSSSFGETFVAVLETFSGVLKESEKVFVTDKIRAEARKALPGDFVIMTRENISQMLPPGKSIEDCEGSCLVETGRNISADYVAQGRVDKVGKSLYLTIELYSTESNDLMSSISETAKNVDQLVKLLDSKAGGLFAQILAKRKASESMPEGKILYDLKQKKGSGTHLVEISTDPAGASFIVVDEQIPGCSSTPCMIEIAPGEHHFIFTLEGYQVKDTIMKTDGWSKKIALERNYGFADITPRYSSSQKPIVIIDNNGGIVGRNRLPVGRHHGKIMHVCYEPLEFSFALTPDKNVVIDGYLTPLMSVLQLSAEENGTPKALPVYVDDKEVGTTPFAGTVPYCSMQNIRVGDDFVDLDLVPNKTIKYVHKVNSSFFTDPRDGNRYRVAKYGNLTWMNENLRYKTKNSFCYNNDCRMYSKYGSYYAWDEAMNVCPSGWRLPDSTEIWGLLESAGVRYHADQYGRFHADQLLEASALKSDPKKLKIEPSGFDMMHGGRGIADEVTGPYVRDFEKYGMFWLSRATSVFGKDAAYAFLMWTGGLAKFATELKINMLPVRCVK